MSNPANATPRRLRAAIVGFGVESEAGGPRRILTSKHGLVVGGSAETHSVMIETMLRLEDELERRGKTLAEVDPGELIEIALRIDSPELLDLAIQLKEGLESRGASFNELSPEELNELSLSWSSSASA